MITRTELVEARKWAWETVQRAGIPLTKSDYEHLEVADLGLSELEISGLQILTLASTEWLGAKLLIMRPNQFFPQHRHPPSAAENYPGKTEVLRGQSGQAYLFVPGEPTRNPSVQPPEHRRPHCTVWHEVRLWPGDQHICAPNSWHWFQAASEGAIVWSISSKVTDAADQFSDPQVLRETRIGEPKEPKAAN